MTPPPPRAIGDTRLEVHAPANFFEEPVTFLHVVATTSRHHVGPFVTTPATAWDDVVNSVRVLEAVRAAVSIANE